MMNDGVIRYCRCARVHRPIQFFLLISVLLMTGCSRLEHTNPRPASVGKELPGRKADGSVLLPNQWSLKPVGKQIPLGDFPVNLAVHPAGKYVVALNCGYGPNELLVVDLSAGEVVSRFPLKEAFYGLAFTRDGRRVYCSGAGEEMVHQFDFDSSSGMLKNHEKIRLRDPEQIGVASGLALTADAKRLFVANLYGHKISILNPTDAGSMREVKVGHALVSPAVPRKAVDPEDNAADKRAEAALLERAEGPFPYACIVDEIRDRLYVSLWGGKSVVVMKASTGEVTAQWPTEDHPCEMALTRSGRHLLVANAHRNTVTVFDTAGGRAIETIWAALYPQSPPGSTPNSLALSPDEKTLYVANACNNVIAVFDVSKPGRSRSLGFIPSGWYPTSVRVTPDGKKLLVANGKGLQSKANPDGPQPGVRRSGETTVEYIAGLFRGTLSVIDLPEKSQLAKVMADYTVEARRLSPLRPDAGVVTPRPADNPIPDHAGGTSPIKYCLYIVKENRTYDQVLGDMPEGNGDPSLCLFPEEVTPNQHALAREFVLLDNFYVESEVSADGHEWSMGAYASDFVEKIWPLSYGHNAGRKYPFPAEGHFPIATPAGGYLWDRAREAGISYRSYGEFVNAGRTPQAPGTTRVKALQGHFDEWYRPFDMKYSDLKRADRFISELKRFEAAGEMPRLQIVRLPNNHTHGATPGFKTPRAFVAENDLALGQIVEAVSRSKFWGQTAIFVVEDDAQNGPDHVDAHRTTAFVISPYTKRRFVDSTLYSTSSMLRTMELILGLKPMSQFDAAARPMFHSFHAKADPAGFTARPARVNLEETNTRQAWGGELNMNFAKEDAADDLLLNEVIWRSVRGAHSPMPAPVRAGFVCVFEDD